MYTTDLRLVVGILTFNRPRLLERTISSLVENLPSEVSPLVAILDNGSSEANLATNMAMALQFSASFRSIGKAIPNPTSNEQHEHNIGTGFSALATFLGEFEAEFFLLLEDDWECVAPLPLGELCILLGRRKDIGQIRLRRCAYDNSRDGYSTCNFVTRRQIIWQETVPATSSSMVQVGNLHWTNNPSLVSREQIEVLTGTFDAELDIMAAMAPLWPLNAQLVPGAFHHIGTWRVRDDLIAKGLIPGTTTGGERL